MHLFEPIFRKPQPSQIVSVLYLYQICFRMDRVVQTLWSIPVISSCPDGSIESGSSSLSSRYVNQHHSWVCVLLTAVI